MATSSSDRQGLAWITGASSGIGRALALRLARDGWRVAASARREEELAALTAEDVGGRILPFPLDTTDVGAVRATVETIEREFGPIGRAVLCAGTYVRDTPTRFDSAQMRRLAEVNLFGTSHCLEAMVPRMVERRSGHIALVGSVSAYAGLPGGGIYGATKAALVTLAESMYPELKRKGVLISVVNPGFVETPLTALNDFPMPFMITAEDAADRIARGLDSGRFEIAFPWQMVLGLKALRILPYPLQFALTRKMLRRD